MRQSSLLVSLSNGRPWLQLNHTRVSWYTWEAHTKPVHCRSSKQKSMIVALSRNSFNLLAITKKCRIMHNCIHSRIGPFLTCPWWFLTQRQIPVYCLLCCLPGWFCNMLRQFPLICYKGSLRCMAVFLSINLVLGTSKELIADEVEWQVSSACFQKWAGSSSQLLSEPVQYLDSGEDSSRSHTLRPGTSTLHKTDPRGMSLP